MVMELIASVLVVLVMIPVTRRIAWGHVSRGKIAANVFEAMFLHQG